MAQRQVNIKAVGIILVVIIGVLGSITVAKAFLFKKDPKKFIALAEGNIREGNYVDAEANYKIAVVADPKNLDARVKYGDVLHQLARTPCFPWAGPRGVGWRAAGEPHPS